MGVEHLVALEHRICIAIAGTSNVDFFAAIWRASLSARSKPSGMSIPNSANRPRIMFTSCVRCLTRR